MRPPRLTPHADTPGPWTPAQGAISAAETTLLLSIDRSHALGATPLGVRQQQRPASSRGSIRRTAVVLADDRFDRGGGPEPACAPAMERVPASEAMGSSRAGRTSIPRQSGSRGRRVGRVRRLGAGCRPSRMAPRRRRTGPGRSGRGRSRRVSARSAARRAAPHARRTSRGAVVASARRSRAWPERGIRKHA